MATLREQIDEQRSEALTALRGVENGAGLDEWNARYLGKKGQLTGLFRGLGTLPRRRASPGRAVGNAAKTELEEAYDGARERILSAETSKRLQEEAVDVTLPGRPLHAGHLHIITQTTRDILRAFRDMGFQVYEGPDIELDVYNFELLNIPKEHPARSMHDTLYVDDRLLGMRPEGASMDDTPPVVLRTHTSPNQIRMMRRVPPPVRLVVPGTHLPRRGHRRHPRGLLQPDRGHGHRQEDHPGRPQRHAGRLRTGHLRQRPQGALPLRLLPLRRAGRRPVD